MSIWVDTHCHLFGSSQPATDLLERAANAGVEWVVCPGTDAATSGVAGDLAGRHGGRVLAAAGLHPHYADRWPDERDAVAGLAANAVAVGECGLDFYRDLAPRSAQLVAFSEQLELAATLGKPVIVHCRDAFSELFDALEKAAAADVVLHCWTGGPRWTRRFADLDVTFSFAGPIAFPGGDTVRRGAEVAPHDRTMVETDTPYLTPPPHRGDENEPAHVALVGMALAEVWGESAEYVAELTTATAERVFRG